MSIPAERNELIQSNMGYVRALAAQLKKEISSSIDYEDLVAYGIKGLVEAAERFDPTRGVAFTTFAYYRIRGAIFDGLRQQGWLNRNDSCRFSAAANDYLSNATDRPAPPSPTPPSREEVITDLANTLNDLSAIFLTSLTTAKQSELADKSQLDACEALENKEMGTVVKAAVRRLPPKERKLIELYYFDGLNLQSAGKELGLSKSWASRLHSKAIRLLAKEIEELI